MFDKIRKEKELQNLIAICPTKDVCPGKIDACRVL